MNAYDLFRDRVSWRRSLGDEEIPGVENLAPEESIPARVITTTKEVAGDLVSRETIWTYPEHPPKPKDRLNGHRVLSVEAAKDRAGNVRWWIAHLEG